MEEIKIDRDLKSSLIELINAQEFLTNNMKEKLVASIEKRWPIREASGEESESTEESVEENPEEAELERNRVRLSQIGAAEAFEQGYEAASSFVDVEMSDDAERFGNMMDEITGPALTQMDKARLYDAIDDDAVTVGLVRAAEELFEAQENHKPIRVTLEERKESAIASKSEDRKALEVFKKRGFFKSLFSAATGKGKEGKQLFESLDRRKKRFETNKTAAGRLQERLNNEKEQYLNKIDAVLEAIENSFSTNPEPDELRKLTSIRAAVEAKRKEMERHFDRQQEKLDIVLAGGMKRLTQRKKYNDALESLGLSRKEDDYQYVQKRLVEKNATQNIMIEMFEGLSNLPQSRQAENEEREFVNQREDKIKAVLAEIEKNPEAIKVLRQALGRKKIDYYATRYRKGKEQLVHIKHHKKMLESLKRLGRDIYDKIGGPQLLTRVTEIEAALSIGA